MKKALITGVGGQDGSYLAEFLLKKGYEVHGTSRDAENSSFRNLKLLKIRESVTVHSMAINDFRNVMQTILNVQPDEIYNLAGQSSVGLSFEQPVETLESISTGTLNILEVIRFSKSPIKFYNAGSGECFGDNKGRPMDLDTPFRPRSPYAVAKATAFWQTANYREAYDLFACSGVLFNHESPLRPNRFVTQKIVSAASKIAAGNIEKLLLGNIKIKRDWGWAPEYVEAMWLMLQKKTPEDFIVATGQSSSLEVFVGEAFAYFGLNWQDHVTIDPKLYRPSELLDSYGAVESTKKNLGWAATKKMKDVVMGMIESDLNKIPS